MRLQGAKKSVRECSVVGTSVALASGSCGGARAVALTQGVITRCYCFLVF